MPYSFSSNCFLSKTFAARRCNGSDPFSIAPRLTILTLVRLLILADTVMRRKVQVLIDCTIFCRDIRSTFDCDRPLINSTPGLERLVNLEQVGLPSLVEIAALRSRPGLDGWRQRIIVHGSVHPLISNNLTHIARLYTLPTFVFFFSVSIFLPTWLKPIGPHIEACNQHTAFLWSRASVFVIARDPNGRPPRLFSQMVCISSVLFIME